MESIESTFPELDVVEYVASGGFKDVFLVSDENDDQVILKAFPVEGRGQLRRARRETEAMSILEADDFVDIYEGFVDVIDDRKTYIIFEEYIPGEDLTARIQRGDTSLGLAVNVLQSIVPVLSEMREKKMIHRDIKPSNIRIGEEGSIKLLDVGIVRFEERKSVTPDGADRGPATPRYASPEQLNNEKDKQSIRSDIFSLGIVFFETITGNHPYEGTSSEVTTAIVDDDKSRLDTYVSNPNLGSSLQMIFETMCEREPYNRYRKPEFILEDLVDLEVI